MENLTSHAVMQSCSHVVMPFFSSNDQSQILLADNGLPLDRNFDNTLKANYFLCDEENHAGSLLVLDAFVVQSFVSPSKNITLHCFPNPTSDNLHVNLRTELSPSDTNLIIEVFDSYGRRTFKNQVSVVSQDFIISSHAFPSSGVYLLKVNDGSKSELKTIVKF